MDFVDAARVLGLRTDTPVFGEPLRAALEFAAVSLGLSLEDFLLAAKHRGSASYHSLVKALSVQETYFYRSPRDFELISLVVDELLARGQTSATAWSVGCATGEEVYSLAFELRRLPSVLVVGSDACVSALAFAQAGRYRPWSFRDREAGRIEVVEWIDEAWEVNAPLRRMVRFEELNLAQDEVLPPRALGQSVDFILCRNVLVYLRPELVKKVLQALCDALGPRGLLVLSPHELPASPPPGFVFAGDSGLRRSLPPFASRPSPTPQPRPSQPLAPRQPDRVKRAWASADAGRHEEALALVTGLDDPEVMLLRGLVFAEQGRSSLAEAILRHLLMIEPGSCAAHLQLYLLYQRRHATAEAEASRRALEGLLAGHPADEPVPMSRLNVGQLLAQVEAR